MRHALLTLALAKAWKPQLPQTGNWTQLIEDELDRSLRVYERPTNNDAAYALAEQLLADPGERTSHSAGSGLEWLNSGPLQMPTRGHGTYPCAPVRF